jgi:peptide/nickel transport system substrate-binding protein
VQVRQALAHATDKQQLIDTVLLGLGEPGLSLVTPSQGEGYHSTLQDYAFDMAKANSILDEAGYRDTDGDGVREMPNDPSKPLSFRYSYPSDQNADTGPRFFEVLRDSWKQAGVEITLTPLEADALTTACCPAFDFDVMNWGWFAGVDPASLLNIVTTDQIPTGTSESGYSNPEYDALFAEQEITLDKAQRVQIIHSMQEILMRDVPYIIPFYRQNVESYRTDKFTGWPNDPEAILEMANRENLTKLQAVSR